MRRRSLAREAASGSAGSAVALVAGLGLELGLAYLLGADAATDALFVALRIPLGVAVFFPPTAIQVLLPAMAGWMETGRRVANQNTTVIAAGTFVLTALVAVAGILGAPWLVAVQAPGLDPESQRLAVELARIVFVMVPALATAQVFRAFRYAQRKHGLAAAVQGILGVTVLAALIAPAAQANVRGAAWGYVAGAVAMLLASLALAVAGGYRVAFGPWRGGEPARVARRSGGPLAASGVQLLTRIVEQAVASFFAPGSITILSYANRLVSAVGGTLVLRPLVTTFIGQMSRLYATADHRALRDTLRAGLRAAILVSAGLAGLVAFGGSAFVAGLFSFGEFDPTQAALLGAAVAAYAVALPPAGAQRMMLGANFARLETGSYLRNTLYGAMANIALLAGLAVYWVGELALLAVPAAYAAAQLVNVAHARWLIGRWMSKPIFPGAELISPILFIGLGSATMAAVGFGLGIYEGSGPARLMAGGLLIAAVGAMVMLIGVARFSPETVRSSLRGEVPHTAAAERRRSSDSQAERMAGETSESTPGAGGRVAT